MQADKYAAMEARQETENGLIRYKQEQKLAEEEKVWLEKQYKAAQDQNRLQQQKALAEQESALQMQQFYKLKREKTIIRKQELHYLPVDSILEQQHKDLEERHLRLETRKSTSRRG